FLAQCGQPCLYKPCTAADIRRAIQQRRGLATSTGTEAPGEGGPDHGEAIPEEGTLSILRRGEAYHVRYASTNPYAPEYRGRVCPAEATRRAARQAWGGG